MTQAIGQVTVSTWLNTLDQQYQRYKKAGFEFIFLLRDGIDALPRNDVERMALYREAADRVGLAVHTLQNYASSARKPYAHMAHEYGLEIGHLDAVAGLDDEAAEDALTLAGEQLWPVARLRGHVFVVKSMNPDVGNTPTADAIDRTLADEDPPYADDKQYEYTLPAAYDADEYIALPRNPVQAAVVLRAQFSGAELAVLVTELARL